MNEAETRAELIDPKLKEFYWGVVNGLKIPHKSLVNFSASKNHNNHKDIST